MTFWLVQHFIGNCSSKNSLTATQIFQAPTNKIWIALLIVNIRNGKTFPEKNSHTYDKNHCDVIQNNINISKTTFHKHLWINPQISMLCLAINSQWIPRYPKIESLDNWKRKLKKKIFIILCVIIRTISKETDITVD